MKHLFAVTLIAILVNVALTQDRSRSRYVPQSSEDYDYDNKSPPEVETPPPRRQQQRRHRQPASQPKTSPENPTFTRESVREPSPPQENYRSPPQENYRSPPPRPYREQAVPHPAGLEADHQDSPPFRTRQQGGLIESPSADETPYQGTRSPTESPTIHPERPQRRRRPAKRRRPQKVEDNEDINSGKPIRSREHQRTRPQISSPHENDPHRLQIIQPDVRPPYVEGPRRTPQNLPPRVHTVLENTNDDSESPSRRNSQHPSLAGSPVEHDLPEHIRKPILQPENSGNRLPLEHPEAPRDYPSSHPQPYENPERPESFPRPQQEFHHPQPFTVDQSSNSDNGYHSADNPLPVSPHSSSQNELPIPHSAAPLSGRYESSSSDSYNPTDDKRDYSSYRDPTEDGPSGIPNHVFHRQNSASRENSIQKNTQPPPPLNPEMQRHRSSRPTRIETRVVRVQGQRGRGSDDERVYEVSTIRRNPDGTHRSAGRSHTSGDSEVRLPPQRQPVQAPQPILPEEPKIPLYPQRQISGEVSSRAELPRDRRIEESGHKYPVPSNRLPEPEKIRYNPKPTAFAYTTGDIDQYSHPIRPDSDSNIPILPNHDESAPHEPVHSEPTRTHSRPVNRLPPENNDDEERIRSDTPSRTQSRSNTRSYQRDQDSGRGDAVSHRTRSQDSSYRGENSRQPASSQRTGSRYQGSNPAEESLSDTLRNAPRQDERSPSLGYRSRPQYESSPEERTSNSADSRHSTVNSRSSSRSRQPNPSSASSVRRENVSPRSQNQYDSAPKQHQPRAPSRQEQVPPRSNTRFQCPQPYGFFPDSQQCDKYYECHNGTAVESLCMDGLAFNLVSSPKYLRCDSLRDVDCNSRSELQPAQPTKNCPRRFGLYPHETDCTKFWNCVDGTSTEVQCPPGLVYHDTKATCDWADLVTGTCKTEDLLGFTCPEPSAVDLQDGVYSRYPHPSDCRLHFTCIKGNDGLRRPRMLSCNDGFVFDPTSGQCTRPESVPGCEEYYGPVVVKKKPSRNQQEAGEETEDEEQPSSNSRRRRPNRRTQGRYEA